MKKITAILCMMLLTFNVMAQDFKVKKSGSYADSSIWLKLVSGVWVDAHDIPRAGNSIWIEAGKCLEMNSNFECKDLHINIASDTIRLNTKSNRLEVYGTMISYTGSYPGTTTINGVAGIPAFIQGTIRFKTNIGSRRIFDGQTMSANSQTAGWNMEIEFPSGDTATHYNAVTRCGNLKVLSGTLSVEPYNASSYEIRVAGTDYTAQPGDGVNVGTVLVKKDAKLIAGRLLKNNPTSAANGIGNLTVEKGGIFIPTLSNEVVPTKAYTINGEVVFNMNYAQSFIGKSTNVDAINISNYSYVTLGGTGNKTLVTNTTIANKLKITSLANLNKSTYSLSYATTADLEYNVSRTKGTELISSGSGSATPRNLILDDGVTLDLGGATVNIRGILVKGACASVINGTLNENQP